MTFIRPTSGIGRELTRSGVPLREKVRVVHFDGLETK